MQVSIIIPLFNRLDLTRACLDSLQRTLRGWRYEIILIDDGSTDGTREFLRTLPPERFHVVLNDTGQGYAANNNAGARLARAPLLCLLNNDTVLLPGWLEPMTQLAARRRDVGLVGNVQREPVSGLIDHYGVVFSGEGQPIHAGKDAAAPPAEDYVEWPAVTAACCVVRRKVFQDLGGFDEQFRNGLEDVDFCLRAYAEGYRHFVANRSVIYHHVSASPGRKAHEMENFRRFSARWAERIATDFRVQEPRRRYLPARQRYSWRSRFWLFARTLTQRLLPVPRPCEAGSIFLIVGDTALNPAHTGVASVVRNLAGAFGRIGAPVCLVHWEPDSRSVRLLPSEFSLGLDAESLRVPDPASASRTDAPALFDPAAARLDDPFAAAPALHALPAPPPPGAWIVLPEVPPLKHAAHLAAYAHRHGWRLAVIFHDALATNEPQFFPPDEPNALALHLRAISQADLILPVSDFSDADWRSFTVAKGLRQPPVRMCKLAADTCTRLRTTAPPPRHVPGAPIRLLCVSAVAPRKGHRVLLAAYDLAAAARPDLDLELCCIGAYRPGVDHSAAMLHDAMARYPGKVTWYERVDYSALQALYERSDFTVYPSVLEGFGLPILESLWFRRPCICANFGAMDEVAWGGGCLTVDVRDPQALTDAILALAGSPDRLAALADEIDGRTLRTWDEYARDVLLSLETTAAAP